MTTFVYEFFVHFQRKPWRTTQTYVLCGAKWIGVGGIAMVLNVESLATKGQTIGASNLKQLALGLERNVHEHVARAKGQAGGFSVGHTQLAL
jgi:hypothetical protein